MLDRLIVTLLARPAVRRYLARMLLDEQAVFGPLERLKVAGSAVVNNALFNTISGTIEVGESVFFGHNVCLLTGTHNYRATGARRIDDVPESGRDIVIEDGAWLASNVTVLGPARIGRHAVVAAGSLVNGDVAPFSLVAGSPARKLRSLEADTAAARSR